MSASKRDNEQLVEWENLQPGDVVIGREQGDWLVPADWPGYTVVVAGPYIQVWDTTAAAGASGLLSSGRTDYNSDKRTWAGTGRFRVVKGTGLASAAAYQLRDAIRQDTASSWDSKCQRCGRGTYIGAGTRPIEHDSGSCPAS